MPVLYALVFMALIVTVGCAMAVRSGRKFREQQARLADVLGFTLLKGREAYDRMAPPVERQAAREQRAQLPEPVRRWAERSIRRSASGTYCLWGADDGVPVAVFSESRGSGRNSSTVTVVRADYPKILPFELHIGYEGSMTRLGKKLFDVSDIEIGDPDFDRTVRIRAADADQARAALAKTGAREAILALLGLSKSAYATHLCAQWEEAGTHFDEALTRSRIAAVAAVARTIGGD